MKERLYHARLLPATRLCERFAQLSVSMVWTAWERVISIMDCVPVLFAILMREICGTVREACFYWG